MAGMNLAAPADDDSTFLPDRAFMSLASWALVTPLEHFAI